MKKMLKIVGIIILFGVIIFAIFSVVYNEYIKYLIKQEEKRIDSYKEYEFVLDDEYKVKIYYNSGLEVADASFTTSYNINLKNNTIEIYSTSINHMPVWFFVRPCCPPPSAHVAANRIDELRDQVREREDFTEEQKAQLLELIDQREAWYEKSPFCRG